MAKQIRNTVNEGPLLSGGAGGLVSFHEEPRSEAFSLTRGVDQALCVIKGVSEIIGVGSAHWVRLPWPSEACRPSDDIKSLGLYLAPTPV